MQLHKKRKKCATKKVNATTATLLFPAAVFDCNVIARKFHTGYLHLLFIHFKYQKQMEPTPDKRVYVNELYEAIIYDNVLKTAVIEQVQGRGLVEAATILESKLIDHQYLISISLSPLKNITDESDTTL